MIWRTQLPNQVEYVHSSFGKLNSSMNKHPRLKKKKVIFCPQTIVILLRARNRRESAHAASRAWHTRELPAGAREPFGWTPSLQS